MKSFRHLMLISFIALIALLAIIPGCDTLITEEYRDTTFVDLKIESVYVYIDTNFYADTIYIDTIIIADSSCVTCHLANESKNDIARRQWYNSRHASLDLIDDATGCGLECHSQEAFIASVSDETSPNISLLPIDCFSCHNPHETDAGTLAVEITLRTNEATTLQSGESYDLETSNICARCHQSTESITTLVDNSIEIVVSPEDDSTSTWSRSTEWVAWEDHGSSQADILKSMGGFEFSPLSIADHSSVTNGCNGCHYDSPTGLTLGGHTFNIYDGFNYSVTSCNVGECHPDTDTTNAMTDDILNEYQALHDALHATLGAYLDSANLVDSTIDGNGITAKSTLVNTPALNANLVRTMYNYFLIENDKSRGMHNWYYNRTLMNQSIDYLDAYLNPAPK